MIKEFTGIILADMKTEQECRVKMERDREFTVIHSVTPYVIFC